MTENKSNEVKWTTLPNKAAIYSVPEINSSVSPEIKKNLASLIKRAIEETRKTAESAKNAQSTDQN
jgi:hypothetical protein